MRWSWPLAFLLLVVTVSVTAAQSDVLRALRTNPPDAQQNVFSTLTGGSISLSGDSAVFRAASPEQRATLVRGVVAFARAYTAGAAFTRQYAEQRDSEKPEADRAADANDPLRAQQDGIRQMEASLRSLPPDTRRQMEQQIAQMKTQLAAQSSDPSQKALREQLAAQQARDSAASHKQRMAEWNATYPADPRALIARRLRAFLDLSATVDFDARLERRDGKMRFVDEALEAKPLEWKMLYRAGKPAVDAARAAAQDWLRTLAQ
jgi:hypothetical protein